MEQHIDTQQRLGGRVSAAPEPSRSPPRGTLAAHLAVCEEIAWLEADVLRVAGPGAADAAAEPAACDHDAADAADEDAADREHGGVLCPAAVARRHAAACSRRDALRAIRIRLDRTAAEAAAAPPALSAPVEASLAGTSGSDAAWRTAEAGGGSLKRYRGTTEEERILDELDVKRGKCCGAEEGLGGGPQSEALAAMLSRAITAAVAAAEVTAAPATPPLNSVPPPTAHVLSAAAAAAAAVP